MVVMRRISGAGRGLLVLGAALLLVSLFGNLVFPSTYVAWFTLSGNQPQLPAGAYTGIQVTELLNTLVSGPYLWIAFGCLLVSAAFLTAMAACVLIEVGARLPSAVPVRSRVTTVTSGRRA